MNKIKKIAKAYGIPFVKIKSSVNVDEKINKVADKKSEIIVKNSGLNNEYSCNNQRLMSELNNFNFIEIKDSIKSLYGWYKNVK